LNDDNQPEGLKDGTKRESEREREERERVWMDETGEAKSFFLPYISCPLSRCMIVFVSPSMEGVKHTSTHSFG